MKLTEDEIRKITLSAIEELGDKATPDNVKSIVKKAVESFDVSPGDIKMNESSGRAILTSFGINKPGIVSAITKAISQCQCDIYDLSQKIMGDFFTMIMVVDLTNSPSDLKTVQEELAKVAEELKIKIYLQHEDVFRYMHRI